MKFFNHVLLLFAIFFSITAQAKSLRPNAQKALFYHLTEVNQEWNKQQNLQQLNLTQTVHFQNDNQRIQRHLELVYQVLSKRSTTHLTKVQRANRQRHLAILKSYYDAAVFPTNHYHNERQPYFVDNFEVHCAVGYLLQQDGQTELVATIRENDNYGYIHELTKYSQLEIWAKANGFTVDELAWIQPGYTPIYEFSAVGSGVDGEVLCFAKSYDEQVLYIGGNFTTINGISSPSVARFDGTDFYQIGGITGTVYDMATYQGKLIIAGEFTINSSSIPTNIAIWDGTSWTALQNGNMYGEIYTIEVSASRLYIGGNFHKINGIPTSYLAYYSFGTQQWSNDGIIFHNGTWLTIPNGFSVDSTVYDMKFVEGKLLIGGVFTEVAPNISNPNYNTFITSHLAYWDLGGNWLTGFNTPINTIHALYFYDGRLFTGGEVGLNINNSFSYLSAGLWTHYSGMNGISGFDDNQFNSFFNFNGNVYALGGLEYQPLLGTYGKGIIKVYTKDFGLDLQGAGFTNGSVKTAIEFKDKAYFGGSFDTIGNNQYFHLSGIEANGLAVSELDLENSTQNIGINENHKIWYANSTIIIEKDNYESSDFTLFNVSGQIVHSTQNINNHRQEIPVSDLPKGVYFYKVNSENGAMSGKLVVY